MLSTVLSCFIEKNSKSRSFCEILITDAQLKILNSCQKCIVPKSSVISLNAVAYVWVVLCNVIDKWRNLFRRNNVYLWLLPVFVLNIIWVDWMNDLWILELLGLLLQIDEIVFLLISTSSYPFAIKFELLYIIFCQLQWLLMQYLLIGMVIPLCSSRALCFPA